MIVRRFFKVFCQGFSEVLAGLHQKTNTYQFTMQARKCCRVACRQLIFLGRKIRRFSWQMIQGHWRKLCALTKYLQLTCRLNPVHDLVLSAGFNFTFCSQNVLFGVCSPFPAFILHTNSYKMLLCTCSCQNISNIQWQGGGTVALW